MDIIIGGRDSALTIKELDRGSVSHQSSPHRGPGGAQRGILAENSVHEPTHHTKTRTSHLEDAEDEDALLVENEVPVSVHVQV